MPLYCCHGLPQLLHDHTALLLETLCHTLHVTTYMLPAVVIMIATFQKRRVLTQVLGHALHALYIHLDKLTLVI